MTIRTDRRRGFNGGQGEEIRAEDDAVGHVHGICLKTGPPRRVGVELEWLVRDARDPSLTVPAERIADAVRAFAPEAGPELPSSAAPGVLPSGAFLTAEPGGQLELSSLPAESLAECVSATERDMAALRAAAADAGLNLVGFGLDPLRRPPRILDQPRYAAMEAFFDRGGPWGRQMMCRTASVQVCLDAGDEGGGHTGFRYRWGLLHAIGPVLVAAFANSPLRDGRPTGWRSTRQQVWAHMDPTRTRPPRVHDGSDPRDAWAAYAMDAEVMLVRDPGSANWAAPPGVTFRAWVRGEMGVPRQPTSEDLSYHLSTLFPPVRPRGHFELRMIDAQPGDGWIVPLAVVTALLEDGKAADEALAATEPVTASSGDPWLRGAWLGPSDAVLARASRECFAAAHGALGRMGVPAAITAAVDAFIENYVSRDRCPADDLRADDYRADHTTEAHR
jgi:ergothioneine biosynthesis glutamate--cysteine ligase EgtA